MMTSYTAYLDTGGCRSSGKFLVTGGFVASVQQWDRFETHWRLILEKVGVDCFHMTDFMRREGAFKGDQWKVDGYADNFLKKLVNAICKNVRYAPTVLIYLDDWRTLNREYKLIELNYTPIALAGVTCIGLIYCWCEQRKIAPTHIEFFHEDGDEDRGTLKASVKQWFGFDLPFKPKSLRPLQACDILAWEAAYAIRDHTRQPESSFQLRPSIIEIVNRIECDPKQFTLDGWRHICEEQNIPKR